jgi:sugar O-acyltransferase (sialic acid O-acetyltransferase NeuD family)
MKEVVIFGTGNVARLVHFFLTNDSDFKVAAFTINSAYIKESNYLGLAVTGFESIVETHPPDKYDMFVAIGAQDRNEVRERVYNEVKAKGYKLISYISSKAEYWPDLKFGENVFIIQASSIEPFVEIGNNVALIGTRVGQNVKIEDNCFISTATIGSDVCVGQNAFIGINALINPYIKVGTKSIIGAGSIIVKEVEDYAVYTAPAARKSDVDSRRLRIM